MVDMIKFQQGKLSSLSTQPISNGTLWFTTDEGAIYLDTADKRVRFGDYVIVNTINDLPANGHAHETALYYVKDDNILARWDKNTSKWIQLNAAGLSEISVDTSGGNVLSSVAIVTDARTGAKKLSFTTTSVATSEALTGLQKTVSDLDAAYKAADAALTTKINTAQAAAEAAQTTANTNTQKISDLDTDLQGQIDTINSTIGNTSSGLVKEIADLKAADTTINGRIDDVDAAYKAADIALRKELTGYTAGTGTATGTYKTIKDLSEHMETAESNISTLQGTVNGHTTSITNMQTSINNLNEAVGSEGSVQTRIDDAVAALRKEILTDGAANDNISDAYDTIQEIAAWLGEDQLGKDASTIISELNTLNGTVGNVSSGLVKDVADLKTADTTIRSEFAAADTNLKNLIVSGDAGTGTYKNINKLSEQVVTAEGAISTLQTDLGTLNGTVGGHTTEISNLKAADTAIRQEYANADASLEKKLVSGEGGNSSLATGTYKNINALSTQMSAAESAISTLQGDLSTLNGTVGGHTTALSDLTAALTWGEF